MAYSVGNVIEAADFNGFVSTNAANINGFWGSGATDTGWGQTALGTVATGGIVAATNWSSLVNTLSAAGSHTGTTITSRSAPTTGSLISILANVNTDITNIKTNRGNAAASGTTSSTWSGNLSYTSGAPNNAAGWTLTWTQTVSFADAASARYFWNAGGLVRLDMSKTSTGTDKDPDWNTLAGQVGTIYISGRVNSAAQTIAGVSYTGTTRIGGTGGTQTTLATTTGWYSLTAGSSATTLFQLNDATSPYSGNYIRVTAAINAGATTLTLTTTWVDAGYSGAGKSNNISGGTDTTSPYTAFGTAPAVLCRYVPPSSSYLTNSWGTPAVASSTAAIPLYADFLVVAGGGGGGAGGGGAGGFRTSAGPSGGGAAAESQILLSSGSTYTVTVGAGGPAGTNGSNSVFSSITSLGGGAGAVYGTSNGGTGGSGGAGLNASPTYVKGSGTAGQGYDGGTGWNTPNGGAGNGGGGAGAIGGTGSGGYPNSATNAGGAGGVGVSSSISGSAVYYAGGGGGAGTGGGAGAGGTGGGGTGGNSYSTPDPGTPGSPNTGGGGGGGWNSPGSAGGSGIVIIRYSDTFAALTSVSGGLTYTTATSGGYRRYTFTAGTGTITV